MARVQKKSPASSDKNDLAHPFRESSPQSYRLGAGSCLSCHRRKVRCDHGVPCANCSRCGLTCVYRTKSSEGARKSPTLQQISNRLERLEILLSRLFEGSQVTTESAADGGDGRGRGRGRGESQTQLQLQSGANVNATANQHPSDQHSSESTWELLLNDGQVLRHMNNLNIEILRQDVSLDFFLDSIKFYSRLQRCYTYLPCSDQANMKHPPGRNNQNYQTYWLGNFTFASSEE